jgi:hypothetical protein
MFFLITIVVVISIAYATHVECPINHIPLEVAQNPLGIQNCFGPTADQLSVSSDYVFSKGSGAQYIYFKHHWTGSE